MPSAKDLVPYLEMIDRDKWYTNFGQRLCSFEGRLADHFDVKNENVTTVSSATAGLTITLKVIAADLEISPTRKRRTCLLPAWTFVASAQAVIEAGMDIVFCDVDPVTGALTPRIVSEYLAEPLNIKPDIIMPVVPFGGDVKVSDWDVLSAQAGIPVVIDAAASFYSLEAGRCPAVVSLHATKAFGIGEGGVILSENQNVIQKVRQFSQFGFAGGRLALSYGGNYKLSEYHAAVGLAQFDRLEKVKQRYSQVRNEYFTHLAACENITFLPDEDTKISSTVNVIFGDKKAIAVVEALREKGIGASIWWEDHLHRNQLFNVLNATRSFLVADKFYGGVVALPFSTSLTEREISLVANGIRSL
ncbi:DegT/DnrJ/EryC1/StrS family aminotransferase [Kiloniella litopenaei]|uniref:DegT/DnrJ/EryC1/StrS family aminotransferase n=1 Tax=Kiloniella litopenaei TaxID=1549748 RepID=UPI0006991E8E|nr:DegT/DnrJ/EryC1/StrS family aminotransferase [Kiloniella litopenaei]